MSDLVQGLDVASIISEVTAEEQADPNATPEATSPDSEITSPDPEEPSEEASPEESPDNPPEEASPEPKSIDWWNPDTWGEKSPKEVIPEIQRQFNAKSESEKALNTRVQQLEQGAQQVQQLVVEYLRNPELYRQERLKHGFANDGLDVTPNTPPGLPDINVDAIQDIPSLIKEVQRVTASAVAKERGDVERRIQTAVAQAEARLSVRSNEALKPHYVEKWKSAVSDLSKEDKFGKDFAEVEAQVRESLLKDPSLEHIRTAYSSKSMSESQALSEAYKLKYFDRFMDREIQKRLSKVETTKKASTEPNANRSPKKAPKPSKSTGSISGDIIAETDAEMS